MRSGDPGPRSLSTGPMSPAVTRLSRHASTWSRGVGEVQLAARPEVARAEVDHGLDHVHAAPDRSASRPVPPCRRPCPPRGTGRGSCRAPSGRRPTRVTEARGTVIGMSITIPSSSGVMNSRGSGCIVWSATRATINRLAGARIAHPPAAARSAVETRARKTIARKTGRLPSGAKPSRNVSADHPGQRRRACPSGKRARGDRPRSRCGPAGFPSRT